MTDYKSIIESPFYEKANKYVEETGNNDCTLEAYIDGATEATKELEAQIEKMKIELHHRLVSPSHSDSDCLDKIVCLDRLWQFGQEF